MTDSKSIHLASGVREKIRRGIDLSLTNRT
jgi:hypothetical protein